MTKTDSRERFSNRVSDYARYRPGYPDEAIQWISDYLADNTSQPVIADVGAGTGLLTALLLPIARSVIAVEPNDAMRTKADNSLSHLSGYSSVAGSAETTGLSDNCVDLITAAQAFHWFDLDKTKAEFRRILKPDGNILLIWNRRDARGSLFLSDYETLLKSYIPDYQQVSHANATDTVIGDFLGPDMTLVEFTHCQAFDFTGLKGRLLSSSYCPAEGTIGHEELMNALAALYDLHATEDGVRFDYCTQVYASSKSAFG